MRALLLDQPGSVDTLRVAAAPDPEPGAGEIRVKVAAMGLNPVDYKLAGRGNPAWAYPHILGLDVAGTIDALGAGVDGWALGDRVYYHGDLTRSGGFAEFAITTAHTVAEIPASVSFADAAAIPCAGLTAYQGLVRRLRIQKGQTVWVQGGAGGVGGYGVQIAANAGATVITTSSQRNFDYVKGLGATHVIDYQAEDVVARIMDITEGRGVDAVQAAVDADSADQGLAALAFAGAISCIAGLPTLSDQAFAKAISLHKISLGAAHPSNNRAAQLDLAQMAGEMIALVADKKINPMVEQVIALEDIPAGLAQLESRHVRGKIVAVMG
ncbi:MAG: NADPH2:quinone reductase [Candidatus Latescibacterota bacterium]|jgi:NADPH2:quinone reductase